MVFKDFAQKVTVDPGWFNNGQLEAIEDTIKRMNNWIDEAKPKILNIETVWMPYKQSFDRTKPIKITTSDAKSYYPIQVFRIWHEE